MDPKADAKQTLDDAMKRIVLVEQKEKEVQKMVNYNEYLLNDSKKTLQTEMDFLRSDIRDSKDRLDDITKMIKLISKEFKMIAKEDDLRRVERRIETMMAAKLISRTEAQKFIDSEGL